VHVAQVQVRHDVPQLVGDGQPNVLRPAPVAEHGLRVARLTAPFWNVDDLHVGPRDRLLWRDIHAPVEVRRVAFSRACTHNTQHNIASIEIRSTRGYATCDNKMLNTNRACWLAETPFLQLRSHIPP
jgi:hypothetical protein